MQRLNAPAWKLGVGVILMGGALLLGACNSMKLGQASDDRAITTQVQAKLFDDPVLKTRDIHVTSDNGTVTLSGSVNTELEKAAVERIAGQADGVKKVVDQLEIASASAAGAEAAAPRTAAASGSTARQSEAPAEPPRASAHRHHARSVENNETTSDQVAAAETPAENPQAVATEAAPPQPAAPPAPPAAPAPATAPPPPAPVASPPEQITIPPGTVFSVRMVDSIDSTRSNAGDEFAASLSAPVIVGGRTAFPRNAEARVRLVQATASGRVSGRSELKVELISVNAGGQNYPLETDYYERAGASQGKRTAEGAGGGAVLGALIGALAGRGRGAAIGSVVGAGAGTAVASTHGQQVKIPSETRLEFTLNGPVTVTLNPGT